MKGTDSISTENKHSKANKGKSVLLSLGCVLSVILFGCTDVTSSSGSDNISSAEQSITTTTTNPTASVITAQTTAAATTTFTTAVTVETTVATTTETTTAEPQTQPQTESESGTEPEQTAKEPEQQDTKGSNTQQPSQAEAPAASTDFDTSFFDDALFIGDSITTGLYLYGYLDVACICKARSCAVDSA